MSVDISLISSVDDPADARLHRIISALTRDGLTCEIRTRGKESDAPAGATFYPTIDGKGFLRRIARDIVLPLRAQGKVWIVVSPDLLITASIIGRLRGRKIVGDIHEDYLQLLNDRPWTKRFLGLAGVAGRIAASTATSVARNADLTTVADTHVPPMDAKNRLVLRNLPALNLLTKSTRLSERPTALYIGDVRTSRGLRTMLAAAERATNWHFEIIGNLADSEKPFVAQWSAAHPEVASRVYFRGRMDPKSSWKYAEDAWVGLTLLESTPAFVEAVPSKLYEYMAVGLAIISTPLPRCVELIEKSESGVIAASAEEVADALVRFESDRDRLTTLRANGAAWAERNLDSAAEYASFVAAVRALLR